MRTEVKLKRVTGLLQMRRPYCHVSHVSLAASISIDPVFSAMNRETATSVITRWSYIVLCGLQQADGGSENRWRPVLRLALGVGESAGSRTRIR